MYSYCLKVSAVFLSCVMTCTETLQMWSDADDGMWCSLFIFISSAVWLHEARIVSGVWLFHFRWWWWCGEGLVVCVRGLYTLWVREDSSARAVTPLLYLRLGDVSWDQTEERLLFLTVIHSENESAALDLMIALVLGGVIGQVSLRFVFRNFSGSNRPTLYIRVNHFTPKSKGKIQSLVFHMENEYPILIPLILFFILLFIFITIILLCILKKSHSHYCNPSRCYFVLYIYNCDYSQCWFTLFVP